MVRRLSPHGHGAIGFGGKREEGHLSLQIRGLAGHGLG